MKYNLLDTELNSPFGEKDEVFYCFRQTHNKLYKNQMNSKFIKLHQCTLEKPHVTLTENNPEF